MDRRQAKIGPTKSVHRHMQSMDKQIASAHGQMTSARHYLPSAQGQTAHVNGFIHVVSWNYTPEVKFG